MHMFQNKNKLPNGLSRRRSSSSSYTANEDERHHNHSSLASSSSSHHQHPPRDDSTRSRRGSIGKLTGNFMRKKTGKRERVRIWTVILSIVIINVQFHALAIIAYYDEPGGDCYPVITGAYVPPVIPKSDASRRLIYNAIRNNDLFKACSSDELNDLIDVFSGVHHAEKSIVIREGDHGDGFYVLSTGSVSVYEAMEFMCTLRPGMGFGETALLYSCPRMSCPRTATVRAREECDLWFIDRRAFRAIMARHKRKRLNTKLVLLENVKIHGNTLGEILKPHELHSLAMAAQFKEYSQGQVIVRQGDVGDAFYMIETGCVDVYIREKSETHPVATLKAGDVFGEKALLSSDSDVRTATCVASGRNREVKCVVLTKEDFVRMLGDLEIVLWAAAKSHTSIDRSTPCRHSYNTHLKIHL